MTDTIFSSQPAPAALARNALKAAAQLWFVVATAGLWMFTFYIIAYFIVPIMQDGLGSLANTHLPKGFVPGDGVGNLAVGVHVFLAALVIGGGPLQLVPQIRDRFPRIHRWYGRIYMVTAVLISLAGLYMIWMRGGAFGNTVQHIGTSVDGVLIILFGAMAWRTAIARNFTAHRRWALRLFMAVNAVWFLRLGYRFWAFVNDGSLGNMEVLFNILSYAQYLVPLAILELYFIAQTRGGVGGRFAMAGGLVAVTMVMAVGIYSATTGMWLPRLS